MHKLHAASSSSRKELTLAKYFETNQVSGDAFIARMCKDIKDKQPLYDDLGKDIADKTPYVDAKNFFLDVGSVFRQKHQEGFSTFRLSDLSKEFSSTPETIEAIDSYIRNIVTSVRETKALSQNSADIYIQGKNAKTAYDVHTSMKEAGGNQAAANKAIETANELSEQLEKTISS